MDALILQLDAPMQAWGVHSRFSERDTLLEPSKSGVIGLLAAALGLSRAADLGPLRRLRMGIRVDREGRKMRDFHTVGGGTIPPAMLREYSARAYGVSRANAAGTEAALSQRYFLSDARFIVAMAGEDNAFLRKIAGALVRPKFQLFFGRKSFVPAAPLLLEDEPHIRHGESLQDILESVPWIPSDHDLTWDRGEKRLAPKVDRLRLVLEVDHTTADPARDVILRRPDDPVSFVKGAREFRERGVRTDFTRKPLDLWLESELRKEEVSP